MEATPWVGHLVGKRAFRRLPPKIPEVSGSGHAIAFGKGHGTCFLWDSYSFQQTATALDRIKAIYSFFLHSNTTCICHFTLAKASLKEALKVQRVEGESRKLILSFLISSVLTEGTVDWLWLYFNASTPSLSSVSIRKSRRQLRMDESAIYCNLSQQCNIDLPPTLLPQYCQCGHWYPNSNHCWKEKWTIDESHPLNQYFIYKVWLEQESCWW